MVRGLNGEVTRLEAQADLSWADELRILEAAGLTDGTRILEVGCGSGALTHRLAEVFPSAKITAVDHDPALLTVARHRLNSFGDRIVFLEAAGEDLPLADDSADFAIARIVFQHLADPVAVARQMRAALVSGGTLAVIDVDGEMWGVVEPRFPELDELHARAWGSLANRGGNRFVGRRLWKVLHEAGLRDVTTTICAVNSDDKGLEPFLPLVDPSEAQPLVAEGVLTLGEYRKMVDGYKRFCADPRAFIMTLSFVVTGKAP
jgi:ubiquinone/menaquinone biosynthesis C-methylase UbiE